MAGQEEERGEERAAGNGSPTLIERVTAATERADRKLLLKEIGNRPDQDLAAALIPWLDDPSPRVSGRVLAIFAHHRLDEQVAARLDLLRATEPARASHLRGRYKRLSEERDLGIDPI